MEVTKADVFCDVFWDGDGWYVAPSTGGDGVGPNDLLHDAILAALAAGYRIRQVFETRRNHATKGPQPGPVRDEKTC